jgi:hemerythrin superfamily protein
MATTSRTAKSTVKKTANKTARKATKTTKKTTKKTASTAAARARRATAPRSLPAKRPARATATDAIALLKQDHREVEQLFKRFERTGRDAHAAKRKLVAAMIEALSVHAEIEETVFYPAVRTDMPRSKPDVLEALEEHHVVKVVLSELEDLVPTAERFDAKVTVMMELVRHHVKEEEGELFPDVRKRIARRDLLELGKRLRDAKRIVPTRPHPWAPDEPPANAVVGGAVAVIDRVRGVGKRAVERVRDEFPSR